MERRNLDDAELARVLEEDETTGKITRLLYGDRRPSLPLAVKLLTRLGIPLEAWSQKCPVKRRHHEKAA